MARLTHAIAVEMSAYQAARQSNNVAAAWTALQRAHILSQPIFAAHWQSHLAMLAFAFALRDGREMAGQLLRLALVPLGALSGRLPTGNTGRARISAFALMPVPDDLLPLLRPGAR